jgi:hypothetical protein
MKSRIHGLNRILLLSLALLPMLQGAAAGPPAQGKPSASGAQEATPARATVDRAERLPSSVLDPGSQSKIHVSSTNSSGDCPSGATKLDRCSGVYPNGNSWEIAPCCRTETN